MKSTGRCSMRQRPWGAWEVLCRGPRWQTKRLIISPNKRLSLQFHTHRTENWIVAAGTGLLTIGKRAVRVAPGSMVKIPVRTVHRVHNTGTIALHVIEVQLGKRIREDDIVRLADDFGRVTS